MFTINKQGKNHSGPLCVIQMIPLDEIMIPTNPFRISNTPCGGSPVLKGLRSNQNPKVSIDKVKYGANNVFALCMAKPLKLKKC
jgi:hypothetical protein